MTGLSNITLCYLENLRYIIGKRVKEINEPEQLHAFQAEVRREEEGLRCPPAPEKGRGQAIEVHRAAK
ncbi:MAG: hypothetical protein COB99_07395 [Sulfurimonas sp.]|nr:MAG: hypothetical protein COB99_07395 [Sulfurimonas sp.]